MLPVKPGPEALDAALQGVRALHPGADPLPALAALTAALRPRNSREAAARIRWLELLRQLEQEPATQLALREALLRLAGARAAPLPVLQARCTTAIRKRPGRSEFQRGIVEPAPAGGWQVRLTGSQGAGVLRSMSEANALVALGHEQGSVAEGEFVDVWLFEGLA